MNFNADLSSRIVKGVIGLVIIISGIVYRNWVGLIGVMLLFTAITGGCGFGSKNCNVDYTEIEKKNGKIRE